MLKKALSTNHVLLGETIFQSYKLCNPIRYVCSKKKNTAKIKFSIENTREYYILKAF